MQTTTVQSSTPTPIYTTSSVIQSAPRPMTTTYSSGLIPHAAATGYTGYSSTIIGEEANLYRPEGTEYVPPGRPLRGGMQPLYSMHEVRTYEAAPVFQSQPVVYEQNPRGVSGIESEISQRGPIKHQRKAATSTKRKLCC